MVQRRAAVGGQGERQSAVVEQFASKGFVPASVATDAEKQAQRTWDRSSLMAVKDDDSQTRRGLGASSGASSGHKRTMSFVSAGGAPASTAANTGAPALVSSGGASYQMGGGAASTHTPPTSSGLGGGAPAGALPPGWTAQRDPATGYPYYINMTTGATQWEPPAALAPRPPPVPPPQLTPALPAGWISAPDPASGRLYFYNAASGVTQWERPMTEPAPPLPPGPGPPLPTEPAPAPPAGDDQWRAGQGADASVRVAGIPPDMGDLDVRELFAPCGAIVSFSVSGSVYSAHAQPRMATVRFDTPASAANAVRMIDGMKLRNNTLKVMLEAQRARSAAKPY